MVQYRTVPLWSVPKSSTERGAFTWVQKKSSGPFQNRSRNWAIQKRGPEIGKIQYLYHSVLMRTEAVRYHTAFQTCLVSTGDTKLITSDVKVEIRPNCTSLILPIVWSFENRPLTSTVYPLINFKIHVNV